MKVFGHKSKSALITVLFILISASPLWSAPTGILSKDSSSSSSGSATVEGFRSAKFGMNPNQVLNAIANDFKIMKSKVKKETHPTERTTSYLVEVEDLIPDSGKARVAYIFGFKSKRLFQVNVLWGNPGKKEANPQGLISTANLLRNLFMKKGFSKDKVVANAQLKDGSIIVFRARDGRGRMVLLYLNNPVGTPEQAKLKSAKVKAELAKKITLMLSYMEKPTKPDVFKLKSEDF